MTTLVLCLLASQGWTSSRDFEPRGNNRFSDDQIRNLAVNAGWNMKDPMQLVRLIQDAYIRDGYLMATIAIERAAGDSTLIVTIDEGRRTRVGEIRFTGAKKFRDDQLRSIFGVNTGDAFKPGGLSQSIDRLLRKYDAEGYPFAQVWMDSLRLDVKTNSVNVAMYIVEGGQKTLHSVKVEGLKKTKEELAVRLSGLTPGVPYNGKRLHESYLRLTTSGIFDEVSYPTVRLSKDGQGVEALIKVLEPLRSNSFAGAFGFADREGQDERVLSGMVRLDLINIGGSLRDFNVFWRNDGAGRNETKLAFKQRFLFGRRMSLGVALEQVGLDTLYTWQSVGLESSAPIGRIIGGLFGVDIGSYVDRNTFSEGDISRTLRVRLLAGASFVMGRVDRGGFFEFYNRHAWAQKDLTKRNGLADESLSQYIADVRARAAANISANVHFMSEMNYKGLESNEEFVPLSEQFYLGGAATLRGYRENQFHGRRIAFSRNELLLGRSRSENGYLFADVGYVLQETQDADGVSKQDEVRVGYGFGLRTQSQAGNIDISFGVGDKLSLRQTKVHVILNRNF